MMQPCPCCHDPSSIMIGVGDTYKQGDIMICSRCEQAVIFDDETTLVCARPADLERMNKLADVEAARELMRLTKLRFTDSSGIHRVANDDDNEKE